MDSNAADPIAHFEAWMAEAAKSEPNDPNAVCLATCTPEGRPSARMVLLKGVDAARLRLLHQPRKPQGRRAAGQPLRRALLPLEDRWPRSVRVEGRVERVTDAEADAYYASRARAARASAPGPAGSPARWKAASRWRRRWPNTP